jgi:hypothetical protein
MKCFSEMSLQVVAVRAAENSDFKFEFPMSDSLALRQVIIPPLEWIWRRPTALFSEAAGWRHGGINE